MVFVVDASLMKTAADSLLPIVQSQRERFRVRAQELETVRLCHSCLSDNDDYEHMC